MSESRKRAATRMTGVVSGTPESCRWEALRAGHAADVYDVCLIIVVFFVQPPDGGRSKFSIRI